MERVRRVRPAGVGCPSYSGHLAPAEGFSHSRMHKDSKVEFPNYQMKELLLFRPSPQPLQLRTSPVSSGFLGLGSPAPPPTSAANQFLTPRAPNTGLYASGVGGWGLMTASPFPAWAPSRALQTPTSSYRQPFPFRGVQDLTHHPLGWLGLETLRSQ